MNPSPKDLWQIEYQKKGIPSSFREDPSGSVLDFMNWLRNKGITDGTALDIGCGTGRNSLYLASQGFDVYSLDIVGDMVNRLNRQAQELGYQGKVHAYCQSVTDDWPFPGQKFQVGLDTFCYKHQIDPAGRQVYRRELVRTFKEDGVYLLTLAGVDDGYYGPLLAESPDPHNQVIIDPANNIPSVLFAKEQVEEEFGSAFDLAFYEHKRKEGIMHGKSYLRSTHVFIWRKK